MADKAMEEEARRELDSYLNKFEQFDKKVTSGVDPKAAAEQVNANPAAPSAKPGGPKKKIDARMAAAKRKARESQEKAQKGGGRRSSLVFPAILAAVVSVLAGLAVVAYRSALPQLTPHSPQKLTADRVVLPDGRFLAVHEMGAAADSARFHVLVLHDSKGCRLSMLPNISKEFLVEKGIRLVSFDRPGFGQSDVHPSRNATTDAQDVLAASEKLRLPKKFYIVSLGAGSLGGWATLHFAPERLAGVAMISPWGSFRMKSLTPGELLTAWQAMPRSERVPLFLARLGPGAVSAWYTALAKSTVLRQLAEADLPGWMRVGQEKLLKFPEGLESGAPHWVTEGLRSLLAVAGVPLPEGGSRLALEDGSRAPMTKAVTSHLKQMEAEATLQGVGESLYRDLAAAAADWGFDLADLSSGGAKGEARKRGGEEGFTGKVHLWVGSNDRLAPAELSRYAARVVPAVQLHEVPKTGHYFLYESEAWPKKVLSDLLGLAEAEAIAAKEAEAAAAKYA